MKFMIPIVLFETLSKKLLRRSPGIASSSDHSPPSALRGGEKGGATEKRVHTSRRTGKCTAPSSQSYVITVLDSRTILKPSLKLTNEIHGVIVNWNNYRQ